MKKNRRDCRVSKRTSPTGRTIDGGATEVTPRVWFSSFQQYCMWLVWPNGKWIFTQPHCQAVGSVVYLPGHPCRVVFLDLATSLPSDDFLLFFWRFVGLYGNPQKMNSDNGKSFVGAEGELREAAEKIYQNEKVKDYMKWNRKEIFGPFSQLTQGGALVPSTKQALNRALDQEKGELRHLSE